MANRRTSKKRVLWSCNGLPPCVGAIGEPAWIRRQLHSPRGLRDYPAGFPKPYPGKRGPRLDQRPGLQLWAIGPRRFSPALVALAASKLRLRNLPEVSAVSSDA